jgi:orotidine-5'-phosphate decarboxylase
LIKDDCGLLVNVSRAIIYASGREDFEEKASKVAHEYQHEMKQYLKQ